MLVWRRRRLLGKPNFGGKLKCSCERVSLWHFFFKLATMCWGSGLWPSLHNVFSGKKSSQIDLWSLPLFIFVKGKSIQTYNLSRSLSRRRRSCQQQGSCPRFLDRNLSPYHRSARVRELVNNLSDDELVEALPRITKIISTTRFLYEKCKQKSGEICEKAVKNELNNLCENLFLLVCPLFFKHFPNISENSPLWEHLNKKFI